MEKIYINEILCATNGKLLSGDENNFVTAVSTNSKLITPGTLFVPLKGENFDAHDFIPEAIKNGASVILTQNENICDSNKIFIKVESTLRALQNLAKFYRSKFDIPVIGVTGSVGKTSTKEMIYAALSDKMDTHKTNGNLNNEIGVPLTIFGLERHHNAAVIEMGISEFGEMDVLSEIVQPNYAVISNIGVTHIENLLSRENILKEKFKITNTLDENSKLFINNDNDLLASIQNNKKYDIINFGIKSKCDFMAQNIKIEGNCSYFDAVFDGRKETIKIPAIGIHNVYNALAALAVGVTLGIDVPSLKRGMAKYKNASMRQQIYNLPSFTVVDDTYNANPDSMKSTVQVINSINNCGRRIAILGDMLELGELSHLSHYSVGKDIAKIGLDVLITVGNDAKYIADGASDQDSNILTYCASSNNDAFDFLRSILKENDKITVKGSRGMHMEDIVNKILEIYKGDNNDLV